MNVTSLQTSQNLTLERNLVGGGAHRIFYTAIRPFKCNHANNTPGEKQMHKHYVSSKGPWWKLEPTCSNKCLNTVPKMLCWQVDEGTNWGTCTMNFSNDPILNQFISSTHAHIIKMPKAFSISKIIFFLLCYVQKCCVIYHNVFQV